ncbi:hypothetical protein BGZ49_007849 [Haplosporangium sp. Z 27]|nr:hypothetical protein BGZ49_007849 [Haplosporangium sp. Z 27]
MKISIFGIPLIVENISQYLHRHDLANCVPVSKEWNESFIPQLWRNVSFEERIPTSTLVRYQDFIRIVSGMRYVPSLSSELHLRNLQSLKYDSILTEGNVFEVIQLVASITSLQSLSFRTSSSNSDFEDQLIGSIERHPGLKKLDLRCRGFEHPINLQRLIQASRQLHSIRIQIDRTHYVIAHDLKKQIALAHDAMSKMEDTQFREISIRPSSGDMESVLLLPLIERSPLLERLDIFHIRSQDVFHKLSRLLRTRERSRLRYLSIGSIVKDEKSMDELFRTVGYDSNTDHGYVYGDNSGLQSLAIRTWQEPDQLIIKSLPQYFSKSLMELDLGFSELPTQLIMDILHRLPQLKSVILGILLTNDDLSDSDIMGMTGTPWSCTGLKKLDLRIRNCINDTAQFNSTSTNPSDPRLLEIVFSQIGGLSQLEDWRLSTSLKLLTLENGHLHQLTGLRRLRELDLTSYDSEVAVEDVKWMINHWGRLGRFMVGSTFFPICFSNTDKAHPQNKVIEELLSSRPWIQIVIGNSEI